MLFVWNEMMMIIMMISGYYHHFKFDVFWTKKSLLLLWMKNFFLKEKIKDVRCVCVVISRIVARIVNFEEKNFRDPRLSIQRNWLKTWTLFQWPLFWPLTIIAHRSQLGFVFHRYASMNEWITWSEHQIIGLCMCGWVAKPYWMIEK